MSVKIKSPTGNAAPAPAPIEMNARREGWCGFLTPLRVVLAVLAVFSAYTFSTIPPSLSAHSKAAIRGSTVLITGASSGIGEELALQYGALGANVVICARRQRELDDVAARVLATGGGGAVLAVVTDMGVSADVEALVNATIAKFGGLDTLVVNHALFDEGLFVERDTAALEATLGAQLRVNVLGSAVLLRATLSFLEASTRGGRIVEVSSGTVKIAAPFHPGYGASKSGSNGLFRHVGNELKLLRSPVSITSCILGMIATPDVMRYEGLRSSAFPVADTAVGIIEAADARVKTAFVPKWIALGTWAAFFSEHLEYVFMDSFYTQKIPEYVAKLKEHSRKGE